MWDPQPFHLAEDIARDAFFLKDSPPAASRPQPSPCGCSSPRAFRCGDGRHPRRYRSRLAHPTRPRDQLRVEPEITDVRTPKSDLDRGFITATHHPRHSSQHGDIRQHTARLGCWRTKDHPSAKTHRPQREGDPTPQRARATVTSIECERVLIDAVAPAGSSHQRQIQLLNTGCQASGICRNAACDKFSERLTPSNAHSICRIAGRNHALRQLN